MNLSLQDMCHGDRAVTTDGLGEGPPGRSHLIGPRLAAKLERGLDDLVGAARADGVAASFESAKGGDWERTSAREVPLAGSLEHLASTGEAARLQRQRGDDREGVVRFEQVDVAL